MSSLGIFIIGIVIVIGGLAYGASMAGMSPQWIAVGAVVLAGIGIIIGVTKTRSKDVSHG
jgi:hypothetical protein